jgi:hypothetical protein
MKGISISTILSFAMATMLIIVAALIIRLIFPALGTEGGCPAVQRLNIEEIDSLSKDVKLTGDIRTVKFEVEDCVECLWYYYNITFQQEQIKIRWVDMSTTDKAVIMNVTMDWNGIGNNDGPSNDEKCVEDKSTKGKNTLLLRITQDSVNCDQNCI